MSKTLDLTQSVHDLCAEYPELTAIMADLGFSKITKPGMLGSIGRMMTIPKGAKMQHIDLDEVVAVLTARGFTVTGLDEAPAQNKEEDKENTENAASETESEADAKVRRQKLLQDYVKRLSDGEDLESVRADFVANFKDVDAAEIAMAEQTLIQGGTPIDKVQKLCDVHSALFHGATREEKIANAEKQVSADFKKRATLRAKQNGEETIDTLKDGLPAGAKVKRTDGGDTAYQALRIIPGHPLMIFHQENEAIGDQFKKLRDAVQIGGDVQAELDRARQVAVHYAKKGDLIYPVLKTVYGFSGPSDVMWGVDDEIRDDMKKLSRELAGNPEKAADADWQKRLDAVVTRAEEMIYKEENILFPLCAKNFKKEDWQQIAYDHQDYEFCLIDPIPVWKDAAAIGTKVEKPAEKPETAKAASGDEKVDKLLAFMQSEGMLGGGASGEIHLPSGTFTPEQLDAVLNTIPLELTFVDANDINAYFNQNDGPKLFKRPLAALGRKVTTCHPPKVAPIVEGILDSFKKGDKNDVSVWSERGGEPVLIRYMAVRDKDKNYLGTLECVQHMGFAKEHFSK